MPPPGPLSIASKAVARLYKEDGLYRRELEQQTVRIDQLKKDLEDGKEGEDGNGAFILKQEIQAREETRHIFGPLHKRLADAVQNLEAQITAKTTNDGVEETPKDGPEDEAESLELVEARKWRDLAADLLKGEA